MVKKILIVFALIKALFGYSQLSMGSWMYVNDGTTCNNFGEVGSCSDGRHEASYVQLGDKFYLLGGRENNGRVNIYDPVTDIWTVGATPSMELHHFQAVEYYGLMIIAGAMSDGFPRERSVEEIMIYDPLLDEFIVGPSIPDGRARGGAGCTIYNDEIYLVSGTTSGHRSGGHQTWVDKYNPETDTWTVLSDALRARDHFQVEVIDGKIYAVAGRQSGADGIFLATLAELDVYDVATDSWTDLEKDIPTQRAGNTVAVLNNELLVIGGEREDGDANSEVEAFNPTTETWRTLSPLLTGRHGTQAIVNNENIWLASGSPVRGGSRVQSHEKFSFSTFNTPILSKVVKSDLNGVSNTVVGNTEEIVVTNENGNQAIVITNIELSNNVDYDYQLDVNLPYILKPGNSLSIQVDYSRGSLRNAFSSLIINHTGNTSKKTIQLSSDFFTCKCNK